MRILNRQSQPASGGAIASRKLHQNVASSPGQLRLVGVSVLELDSSGDFWFDYVEIYIDTIDASDTSPRLTLKKGFLEQGSLQWQGNLPINAPYRINADFTHSKGSNQLQLVVALADKGDVL